MLDHNTVHGDIRACNIFITEDGKNSFKVLRSGQIFRFGVVGLQQNCVQQEPSKNFKVPSAPRIVAILGEEIV